MDTVIEMSYMPGTYSELAGKPSSHILEEYWLNSFVTKIMYKFWSYFKVYKIPIFDQFFIREIQI